ncbi:MAG: polysaccharide deacetylase family protein [Thermoanaerobaculia bacterium]
MARLALKVDVDTYVGTLEGIPRLLDLFAREGIRATFFFSLGPDNTGKAVKRIFKKGFIKKVLRANPAASYGIKTMLYGTLLPAPDIGTKRDAIARMREVQAAGHAIGIHAWDHIDWHDRLPGMTREEIDSILGRQHTRFSEIFGERAVLSAAPGWTATALSAEVQQQHGIRITSDTRGGEPFHARRTDGSPSTVIEIPSTLPTLDELLASDRFGASADAREGTIELLRAQVNDAAGAAVHSIHTEIEGGRALAPLFERQVAAWRADGVAFVTLPDVVEGLAGSTAIAVRSLTFATLEGRATPVATGWT